MDRKELIHMLTAESVDLLKEMIAIPSPSFSEDQVCTHISGWLSEKGIPHRRIGNNLIAENIADQSKPTLMLCAHMDTVAPGEGYGFDPYTPDYTLAAQAIEASTGKICRPDEIVAGLGSNDDGASAVAMIAAFRYFCSNNIQSSRSGHCLRNRATPLAAGTSDRLANSPVDFCRETTRDGVVGGVVPETVSGPAFNMILVLSCEEERSGEGGMTGLWRSREVTADYAIVGEPTGMKAATSERGLLVIDATAHGISGHAARNEGRNALYIALEDIERLRSHTFSKTSPRMGKVNLNVTQINAGTAHNVIPDTCTFVIDIRPTEQYTNEEILQELQGICSSELKARNLCNRSSATAEDSPLQKAAEGLGIETFSSPTTSDWMRISCDAVKMGPGESSRSHRKDEFVYISEISHAIDTYIDFINTLTI